MILLAFLLYSTLVLLFGWGLGARFTLKTVQDSFNRKDGE